MNILEQILAVKVDEVAAARRERSLDELTRDARARTAAGVRTTAE